MFTVLGEALLDLVQPTPDGPYVARPGGGPLNIAVGLRRLGHPTQLMARLSSRPLGQVVRGYAERNALGLDASIEVDQPATLAFATLDAHARAAYDFYVDGTSDWGWTDGELNRLPPETRALHTGSLAAALGPGADVVLTMVERLRRTEDVLISFDPNVRAGLMGERRDATARVERFVAASHVVKASDEDLAWLYPGRPAADVLRDWSQSGPALVVVTSGAKGCSARTGSGVQSRANAIEVSVVDTIGAGDAFASGLLSGLAAVDRLSPAGVAVLGRADLDAVLERATVVSALTCKRSGADPPTRADYAAYRA